MREAVATAARLLGENSPEHESALLNLGQLLYGIQANEEAGNVLSAVYQTTRGKYGELHPTAIGAAAMLAVTMARLGRTDEADSLVEAVVAATSKTFGDMAPRMVLAIRLRGIVAMERGDYTAAVSRFKEALSLADAQPVANDIDSVGTLEGLGDAYAALNRLTEAEAAYREMLARNAGGLRALHPDFGQRPLKLAAVLDVQGRCDEAHELIRRAKQAMKSDSNPELQNLLHESFKNC